MNFVTVYKTSRSAGGFLVNGYYTDFPVTSWRDFWLLAPLIQDFDLAFSGSQTSVVAMSCVPASQGSKFNRSSGCVWAPTTSIRTGSRPVSEVLPWRWCLTVAWKPNIGRLHHHIYHDALSREDIAYNHRGEVVLKWAPNQLDIEAGRFGQYGWSWPDWLQMGIGNSFPGQAFDYQKPQQVMPVGVTIRTKSRRAQARLLNQGIATQGQVVGSLAAGAQAMHELLVLEDENTGHWVRGRLKTVTTMIMSIPLAMCEIYKENNRGHNHEKANDGEGFKVRYGPTGADIADQEDFFHQKQQDDMKWLAKFGTFQDAGGDEYFVNENAREWFTVANDWAQYIGAFGYFDFLNPNQEDLRDMTRLDNFTPFYPDLPLKVENLPRPQKNPERRVPLPGLVV